MLKIVTTSIPYTEYKLKIQNMIIIFGNVEEKIISYTSVIKWTEI